MTEMIATKSLSYATRRLLPGDHFVTKTDRDARILLAIGKAKLARVPGHIAPPPASVVAKVVSEESVLEPDEAPVVETADEPEVESPEGPQKRTQRRRRKPRGE